MKIIKTYKTLKLKNGRKAEINSDNSEYDLSIKQDLYDKNISVDSEKHLELAGFTEISDYLDLSNIKSPSSDRQIKSIKSGDLLTPSSTNIAIDIEDTENIIAIEFSPSNGEILDWYTPSSMMTPITSISLESSKSLYSHNLSTKTNRQAIFEIPLEISYPLKNEAYSIKRFSPIKKLKKIIKFYVIKKIKNLTKNLLMKLIKKIDKSFVSREKLGHFPKTGSPRKLTKNQNKKAKNQKGLLFVHGIISSISGAFNDIQKDQSFFKELHKKYNGNLLAFDHWTLSKSITQNSEDLAKLLPIGMELDIICHSRGAGVVRSLLELKDNQDLLENKGITIRNVCFVAGACEGSQLATKDALNRIFKVVNKMSILLGAPGVSTAAITIVLRLILSGVQNLPGTDSMDPEGKYVTKLNKSIRTLANEYHYLRANFSPENSITAAFDEAIIDQVIFNNKANDVVVPFEGAGKNDHYLKDRVTKITALDLGKSNLEQSKIWHITFFGDKEVQNALRLSLS